MGDIWVRQVLNRSPGITYKAWAPEETDSSHLDQAGIPIKSSPPKCPKCVHWHACYTGRSTDQFVQYSKAIVKNPVWNPTKYPFDHLE
jgi:hypothetical protein